MTTISVEEAVRVLNSAVRADPVAMTALVDTRVLCNDNMAKHPTIQVLAPDGEPEGPCEVGFLGVLNGLFGIRHDGRGNIEAIYDGIHPTLAGFRIGPTKDLSED